MDSYEKRRDAYVAEQCAAGLETEREITAVIENLRAAGFEDGAIIDGLVRALLGTLATATLADMEFWIGEIARITGEWAEDLKRAIAEIEREQAH
jgi:hypothetical protein